MAKKKMKAGSPAEERKESKSKEYTELKLGKETIEKKMGLKAKRK